MKRLIPLVALWIICLALPVLASEGAEETFFIFSDPVEETAATEPAEAAAQDAHPWTYAIPRELLEDPDDLIQLVNKENRLDSDYPPDDALHKLVNASVKKTSSSEMQVREVTNDALVRMFEDAAAEGLSLRLKSAYRSHYRQSVMYENRLKDIGRDDGVVQAGGASEHQTGLAIDILNPEWGEKPRMTEAFANTAEAKWMAANCHKYGFIIRYQKEKEDITGITYEPWHLRYVGVEVATYIMENGLSLEEFTAEWRHALAEYELYTPSEVAVDSFTF